MTLLNTTFFFSALHKIKDSKPKHNQITQFSPIINSIKDIEEIIEEECFNEEVEAHFFNKTNSNNYINKLVKSAKESIMNLYLNLLNVHH